MRKDREHDVVVIGGGHNGLVSGCYLARAGLDVVVVERQEYAGGMAITRPLIDAAPDHLVSPCAYEDVYLRAAGIVEDLGLARFGFREVDAAGWAWLGDGGESLVFQDDVAATVVEVARFSRRDGDRYRELMTVAARALALQDRFGAADPRRPGLGVIAGAIWQLVSDRRLRALLPTLLASTAVEAITSTFESDEVRGAFLGIATILGSPTGEGSAIALLGPATLHHMGAGRPIGGMGALIAALERCLAAHGGELICGSGVTGIDAAGGRAQAVRLEDGTTIRARTAVVAAIPPQGLPDLTGDALDPAVGARLRGAPANAGGIGCLTVNVALDGRLDLPRHRRADHDLRRPTLFTGTFDQVLRACEACERGALPERPTWWMAIFTALDPSQAPDGQDVAQLYQPAPVHPAGGWDRRRAEAGDGLVSAVASAAPALPALELGRYVETPADLAARTGARNGCIYHVDHVPTRLGPLRPALGAGGHRTPLAGLYLSGAGTHPGGGISGLPGKLSAEAVLRDARSRSRSAANAKAAK